MPILNGLVKKVFGEGGEAVEFGNDELKEWMVKFLEYQHFSFWLKRYGTEFMDLYDLGAQGRTEIKALIEEMAKVTGLPVKRIVSEFVELAGGMLADEADYNYIKGLG